MAALLLLRFLFWNLSRTFLMAELEGGREGAALSQARIAAVGKVSAKHQKYIWRKRARGEEEKGFLQRRPTELSNRARAKLIPGLLNLFQHPGSASFLAVPRRASPLLYILALPVASTRKDNGLIKVLTDRFVLRFPRAVTRPALSRF